MRNAAPKLFLLLPFFERQMLRKRYITYLFTMLIVLFTALVVTEKSYAAPQKIPQTPTCIFSFFTSTNTVSFSEAGLECNYKAMDTFLPYISYEGIRYPIVAVLAWIWNALVSIVAIVLALLCFLVSIIINVLIFLFTPQH